MTDEMTGGASARSAAGGSPNGSPGARALIAVIDTAGNRALVAAGSMDGTLLAEERWQAGYRHGEELLARLDALLGRSGIRLHDLAAIVVGTGPGAFTGLRVGLATAKALASGLQIPIAGVATSSALLEAGRSLEPGARLALVLPAGPSDRVLVLDGEAPQLIRSGDELPVDPGASIVAVDLEGRADADALERGRRAEDGLGREMLRLGVERLRTGGDDIATLVPEYVSLPRGVAAMAGEVRWSRDRG